jgi:hypothetical protein
MVTIHLKTSDIVVSFLRGMAVNKPKPMGHFSRYKIKIKNKNTTGNMPIPHVILNQL